MPSTGGEPPGDAYSALFFRTKAEIATAADELSLCDRGADDGISCTTGINHVFYTCGSEVDTGPTGRPYEDFCFDLDLTAVDV